MSKASVKAILEEYTGPELKKMIRATNITGYSKLKKDELIKLMTRTEHIERFSSIRKKSEREAPVSKAKVNKQFKKQVKSTGAKLKFELKEESKKIDERLKKKFPKKAKPDFLDLDKDGDKKEPMKKAAAQAKKLQLKQRKKGKDSSATSKTTNERLQELIKEEERKIKDKIPKDLLDRYTKGQLAKIEKEATKRAKETIKKAEKEEAESDFVPVKRGDIIKTREGIQVIVKVNPKTVSLQKLSTLVKNQDKKNPISVYDPNPLPKYTGKEKPTLELTRLTEDFPKRKFIKKV